MEEILKTWNEACAYLEKRISDLEKRVAELEAKMPSENSESEE